MSLSLAKDIRIHLARYLADQISLDDFDAWLAAATWDVERGDEHEAHWLAAEIMLRLAEFSRGHWSEADLRERFSGLQPSWLRLVDQVATGSTLEARIEQSISFGSASTSNLVFPLPTATPSAEWFPPARPVSEDSAHKVITDPVQLTASA